MATTTFVAGKTAPETVSRSVPFGRIAGAAGLITVVGGLVQTFALGTTPGAGDSTADIAKYFSNNTAAHRIGVVVPALIAIPIAVFFVGVYRTLVSADRARDTAWAPLFLFGAIMASATVGLSEALFAIPVLREGAVELSTLRVIVDGGQIAQATVGVWAAVAFGAVAAATFQHRIRAAWYGWYCAVAAVLGVLGVIETVSTTTGGVFTQVAFFAGLFLWVTITSVVMLRD